MKNVTFNNVLTIKNGKNQKQVENPNGRYPIYGSGGIMGYADDYICSEDTVVIGRKGNINKPLYVDEPFWNVDTAFGLEADRSVLLPKYLYYYCLRFDFERLNKAVTIPSLTKADLLKIEMDLPDLDIQEAIADRLERIECVMSMREQELHKLDELIKARFVEMFGDMADPDCKWDKCRIVDTCTCADDIKCGPFGTQLGKDEYTTEGIAVWEIPQINAGFSAEPTHYITEEKARALEAYSIIPGDIAMSRKGNVGRCAVFPENYKTGVIHSDVLRIRVDDKRIAPEFMMRQLHYSRDVEHQIELVSSGAIMAGINVTKLKEINVYVPPKELQDKFVDFIKQVDKSKVA